MWENMVEVKLIADCMLGRLARWLRVMGYDTLFQPSYPEDTLQRHVQEGRRLLSRNQSLQGAFPDVLVIQSDRVEKQLHETLQGLGLVPDRSRWFSRCLDCNVFLAEAGLEERLENVPDYILYENPVGIRHCACCNRYFWPGTHRENMLRKLEDWGF
jgi:uncharacterized protein with PIN domain